MTTTLIHGELLPISDAVLFADGERLALVGFLAGYCGLTRQAYTMDLRMFMAWCAENTNGLLRQYFPKRTSLPVLPGRPRRRAQRTASTNPRLAETIRSTRPSVAMTP